MKRMASVSRPVNPEISSKLPLVEIAGDKRILIENHQGVVGYSTEEIQVKVAYGVLCITGFGLKFTQIQREQLVINGRIDTVMLLRR